MKSFVENSREIWGMPLRKRRWEPLWHLQKTSTLGGKNRVKEEKSRLFWGLNFAVHLREERSTAVHLPHCLAPQTYLASVILDREERLKMAGGCWCLDH